MVDFKQVKALGASILGLKIPGAILGPVFLGLLSLGQGYSRALTNISYPLLFAWALVWLFYGRRAWPFRVGDFPRQWRRGLAIYLAVYLLTAFIGAGIVRSLTYLLIDLYVIFAAPIAWLALSSWPRLIHFLPYAYGLGLMATGYVTFGQAKHCLGCVRARGFLGTIDMGGLLIQLAPIMVGALAMAQSDTGKKRVAKSLFFLAALGASFVAMMTNCTRITLLCLPFLCAVMFVVNFRSFKNLVGVVLVLAALAGAFQIARNAQVLDRFRDIATPASGSRNNAERFNYWEHGLEVFLDHPVFGIGPSNKPGLPPEKMIRRKSFAYQHAHNVFLTVMAEMGIVGLAAFLFFVTRPIKVLWPHRRSPDKLTFFWVWSAFMVVSHLFLNGITDHVFGNKPMMILQFTVVGAAMWVAVGRDPPAWPKRPRRLRAVSLVGKSTRNGL
ncbi:MAG: O-antigen ligase family protein [Deltaproteobacteria bacterium]|jgi:O-antigen ligase|nr:O-antigen ligase family protein [Deltaproteobacteria bacterium]